jgi:hypothetical protein
LAELGSDILATPNAHVLATVAASVYSRSMMKSRTIMDVTIGGAIGVRQS